MGIYKEFREFAMRGNMIDMAIGIIIGAAFGKIVSSMVNDIMMPPIGIILGGVDFKDFSMVLKPAVGSAPAVILKYGTFINNMIDFLIVAFVVFMMIRTINSMKRKEDQKPAAPPKPSGQEKLLTEIRDLLKKKH
jgi:large conductance mechanosensitive channel